MKLQVLKVFTLGSDGLEKERPAYSTYQFLVKILFATISNLTDDANPALKSQNL